MRERKSLKKQAMFLTEIKLPTEKSLSGIFYSIKSFSPSKSSFKTVPAEISSAMSFFAIKVSAFL